MAEQDQVSREAFDRIKQENAEFKSKLAEATQALQDVSIRDKAYAHLKGVDGIADPYTAATNAIPQLRGVEEDNFTTTLDSWVEQQKSMFGSQPPPDPQTPAPDPSIISQSGPNPGADGAPIKPKVLGWDDPEVVELRKKGRTQELSKMVDDGTLVLSESNPYAKARPSGR